MPQQAMLPPCPPGLCHPARGLPPCPVLPPDQPALRLLDAAQQERPQYLYHFVLHAALDAVEEQEWRTTAMHLGVVDRFNNLQVWRPGRWGGGGIWRIKVAVGACGLTS